MAMRRNSPCCSRAMSVPTLAPAAAVRSTRFSFPARTPSGRVSVGGKVEESVMNRDEVRAWGKGLQPLQRSLLPYLDLRNGETANGREETRITQQGPFAVRDSRTRAFRFSPQLCHVWPQRASPGG